MVLLEKNQQQITEQGTEKLYNGTRTFFEFPTNISPANFIHNTFEDCKQILDYSLSKIDSGYYIVLLKIQLDKTKAPVSLQLECWEDGFMIYRSKQVFADAISVVLEQMRQQTFSPSKN